MSLKCCYKNQCQHYVDTRALLYNIALAIAYFSSPSSSRSSALVTSLVLTLAIVRPSYFPGLNASHSSSVDTSLILPLATALLSYFPGPNSSQGPASATSLVLTPAKAQPQLLPWS